MTVNTHVHDALDRVDSEQERVTGELSAFDRFETGVRELDPVSPAELTQTTSHANGGTDLASTAFRRNAARADRLARVRDLFAETVRPYSLDDVDGSEPLVKTIGEEFGAEVAAVVSPATPGRFTAEVKEAILSAVEGRQTKSRAMGRALDREETSLAEALDAFEATTDRLVDGNETPLSELGFDALQGRHETLTAHRSRCEAVVQDRQDVLHATTSYDASVGITHQSLVEYLYGDLPTVSPVLSTAIRFDSLCADCQRTVRDHLTRRA